VPCPKHQSDRHVRMLRRARATNRIVDTRFPPRPGAWREKGSASQRVGRPPEFRCENYRLFRKGLERRLGASLSSKTPFEEPNGHKHCRPCWPYRSGARPRPFPMRASFCKVPTREMADGNGPNRRPQNHNPNQTRNQSTNRPTASSKAPSLIPKCKASHTRRFPPRVDNRSLCHTLPRHPALPSPGSPACSPHTPLVGQRRKSARTSGNEAVNSAVSCKWRKARNRPQSMVHSESSP